MFYRTKKELQEKNKSCIIPTYAAVVLFLKTKVAKCMIITVLCLILKKKKAVSVLWQRYFFMTIGEDENLHTASNTE